MLKRVNYRLYLKNLACAVDITYIDHQHVYGRLVKKGDDIKARQRQRRDSDKIARY